MKIDYPELKAGRQREDLRARFPNVVSQYWKLGDSLFNPINQPYAKHGVATGTTVERGLIGPARHLDGTSGDYVSLWGLGVGGVTEGPPLNQYSTISFWINFDDLTTGADQYGTHCLVSSSQPLTPGITGGVRTWNLTYCDNTHTYFPNTFVLWMGDGANAYPIGNTVKVSNSVAPIPGQWYHFAAVLDITTSSNNKSQFYLNGRRLGLQSNQTRTAWGIGDTQNVLTRVGYTTPWYDPDFGHVANYSSFKGSIQELAFLRVMLRADEVLEYYQDLALPPPPALPPLYHHNITDVTISEAVSLTETLDRSYVHSAKITETVALTDTVSTAAIYTRIISESVDLSETLSWDDHIYVYITETLDLADSLGRELSLTRKIGEAVGLTDTLDRSANLTTKVSESVTLTDEPDTTRDTSISESVTLADTVVGSHARIFFNFNIFNELEYEKVFLSHTISNSITAPLYMSKNFRGTAITIENDILASLWLSRQIRNSITDHNYIYLTKKLVHNIMPSASLTNAMPAYRITLDGVDVTAKVESCTISYSLGSFVGEVDVTWADYTLFDDLDVSNIAINYQQERLVVHTRMNSDENPTWVLQGRFFLEKRGTTVGISSIVPTSWGRSRPALLSLPYAQGITYVWAADTTAKTIAKRIASQAGVSLSWEVTDYPILAGILTADGSEPIQIISQLAAAVGGVLTCSNSGQLIVKYRYNLSARSDSTFVSLPETPQINSIVGGDQQAAVYFS